MPFGDVEEMPGDLARRLHQIAVALFQTEVEACGYDLTPVQYSALITIERNPDIDQATLAGAIAYDRTTITGVIDRLTRKGLVTRKISARDRRARELTITEAGTETLRTLQPVVAAAQQTLTNDLTDGEAQELIRLLQKVISALNDRSRAPLLNLLANCLQSTQFVP